MVGLVTMSGCPDAVIMQFNSNKSNYCMCFPKRAVVFACGLQLGYCPEGNEGALYFVKTHTHTHTNCRTDSGTGWESLFSQARLQSASVFPSTDGSSVALSMFICLTEFFVESGMFPFF